MSSGQVMDIMKKHLAIAQPALCILVLGGMVAAQTLVGAPEQELAVKRFGGYPISRSLSSLWLAGSNRRPLIMVYFYGPRDWYQTLWNFASNFEGGKPEWAELQSQNLRLHIEFYPETWEVAVQSNKFRVKESNTFLVIYTGKLLVPQKVIPLGVFDFPPSTSTPASLLLLQAHQQLVQRINKEAKDDINRSEFGNSPYHFLTRPCQKNIDLLYRNPSLSLGTALLLPSLVPREKLLRINYTLPCWRRLVSSYDVQ